MDEIGGENVGKPEPGGFEPARTAKPAQQARASESKPSPGEATKEQGSCPPAPSSDEGSDRKISRMLRLVDHVISEIQQHTSKSEALYRAPKRRPRSAGQDEATKK